MINIEEFKKAQEYIASINKIDLKDLEVEGIEISAERARAAPDDRSVSDGRRTDRSRSAT